MAAGAPRPPGDGPSHRGRFTIPSLDGIRALAVATVFLTHAGVPRLPAPLGVTVFFFLSGYLITTLLRMEHESTGGISFRAFYLRRTFRILPPLYIVIGLGVAVTGLGLVGAQHLHVWSTAAHVLFLSNYQILHAGWAGPHTGRPPGLGDLWSLSVEEHFYLLFPLAFLLLCRFVPSRRRQAAVLLAACAAVLAWRCVLMWGLHASFDRTYVATDTRIDAILFGCVLAVWRNPALDEPGRRSWRGPDLCSLLALPCAFVVLLTAGVIPVNTTLLGWLTDPKISGTLQYTVQGLCLLPIFVVVVRHHRWPVIRLLNARAMVFIGGLSYSIYISHQLLIAVVRQNLPGGQVAHGVMYLAATLGFASLMFVVVEQPFARLRRNLSRIGPSADLEPAAGVPASDPPGRGCATLEEREVGALAAGQRTPR
ncbi:MAG TPA: acyltransferase [Acidimicrobiales bacterium]|nr:acyltransferase [Acidimicrobiales bacterium]